MIINSTTLKSVQLVDGSTLTFDLSSVKRNDVSISTPLYMSEYKNGINLSLIQMLNEESNVGFGKGANLNVWYKLKEVNSTTLRLTHPTFETEDFVLDTNPENEKATYKSAISDRYITKENMGYRSFVLYDINVEIEFQEHFNSIKQYNINIKGENTHKLLFAYNEEKLWIIGNDNELAESVGFTYDETTGNCTSIVGCKKMDTNSEVTQIQKIELTYSNDKINKLRVFNHSTTLPQITRQFTMNGQQIFVYDERTPLYNTIKLDQLSTGKYYVSEVDVDNQKLLVTYNNGYKTTVLSKINKIVN